MFQTVRKFWHRVTGKSERDARQVAIEARQELRRIKARYDSAQTNEDNRRYWANADGLSAVEANTQSIRSTLRNRSRYEYANNGYCSGIVRGRADDLVGTGPTLRIVEQDNELSRIVQTRFAEWADATRLAEKLHTMDQARCRDGEAFAVFRTNPLLRSQVKLDVEPIECDRITDPFLTGVVNQNALDGITYDAAGNPVSYVILREHPGSATLFMTPGAYDVEPAKNVIHWFRRDRPGQLRGVPELTASLPVFAYLRRYLLANLSAAEIAASFAAVLETNAEADQTEPPDPFESLEIDRGMMSTLPVNTKMHQFEAKHPGPGYAEFKRENLNECGRPVRMPTNIVTADSSKHNFSSAKLDHYGYRGAIGVDRAFARLNVLEPIYWIWAEEAALIPGYLPRGVSPLALKRRWTWPGWKSMDKNEAKEDTEQLLNGTTTLSELHGEWNEDWREVIDQRAIEVAYCNAKGVPLPGKSAPVAPEEKPVEEPDSTEAHGNDRDLRSAAYLNGFSRNGGQHGN